MKNHSLNLILIISLTLSVVANGEKLRNVEVIRRILHQPLFPESSSPPPGLDDSSSLAPPPPLADNSGDTPDQPFFPEVPAGSTPTQNPPPPPPVTSNGVSPIPTATQPAAKPTKKVAIAVSVVIVTLGMLSALAFFLYKHRVKNPVETQKLVGGGGGGRGVNNSTRHTEEPRVPPSNFLNSDGNCGICR